MTTVYLLTKEQMREGEIIYDPLRFYVSKKKAGRVFRKQCRKYSDGTKIKEGVWQAGDIAYGERISIKEIRLRTDTIPKKIYVRQKKTYVEGHQVVLDIVSLKQEEGLWIEVYCGEWEKEWLEKTCILLSLLQVSLFLIIEIFEISPKIATFSLPLFGILPVYLVGYVLYLIHGQHIEQKMNYGKRK